MVRADRPPPPARLAIFARAPEPGRAKTRLIPALGPEGAARLHARLLVWTAEAAAASRCRPLSLWCTPDARHPLFRRLSARLGIELKVQAEGDLGARMRAAAEAELGGGPTLLIGSDCPGLSAGVLDQAAARLRDGADAVLVPAVDGGYALLGLARSAPQLFERVPWGTDGVLAETRARLRALGWCWDELDPLWDVDRPEDLARLARARALLVTSRWRGARGLAGAQDSS